MHDFLFHPSSLSHLTGRAVVGVSSLFVSMHVRSAIFLHSVGVWSELGFFIGGLPCEFYLDFRIDL